jgi:hypothetical protein
MNSLVARLILTGLLAGLALWLSPTDMLLIAAGACFALAMTCMAGTQPVRHRLGRLPGVANRWHVGDLAARADLPTDICAFGRLAAFDAMTVVPDAREDALRTALESATDSVMADRAWRVANLNGNAKSQVGRGRDLEGMGFWKVFPEAMENAFGGAYRPKPIGGATVPAMRLARLIGSERRDRPGVPQSVLPGQSRCWACASAQRGR